MAGSYFGDVDIFVGDGQNGWDGTAIADMPSSLLVLNWKDLKNIWDKFDDVW